MVIQRRSARSQQYHHQGVVTGSPEVLQLACHARCEKSAISLLSALMVSLWRYQSPWRWQLPGYEYWLLLYAVDIPLHAQHSGFHIIVPSSLCALLSLLHLVRDVCIALEMESVHKYCLWAVRDINHGIYQNNRQTYTNHSRNTSLQPQSEACHLSCMQSIAILRNTSLDSCRAIIVECLDQDNPICLQALVSFPGRTV